MEKYRKRPVVVEVKQWTGDNQLEIFRWSNNLVEQYPGSSRQHLTISTLEGIMSANIGDYIIKGVNGEFYPCKPEIFEKTYEVVK